MDLHANPQHFSADEFIWQEELSTNSRSMHERALNRAKKYLVAEAELLESIIEIDRNRTYEAFGLTHLTPYCVKYLSLSEDVAANFVRVARKSQQIPQLKRAIDEGRLTISKAKAITAVLTPLNQAGWIEKAKALSKEKLEREVAATMPQQAKPERAKAVGINRTRVEFDLEHKDMDAFRRAQTLISQKLGRFVTLAETQKALLQYFLHREDPLHKANRAQKRKARPSRDGSAQTKRRKRPAVIEHTVNQRDQACCQMRLPDGSICGGTRWLHLHNIVSVAEGGADTAENLITLCSSHHRLLHKRQELKQFA